MNALIVTLLVVLAAYDITASDCPVCDKATQNLPVNGTITLQNGQVCCISDGKIYFCQAPEAAVADGGLLQSILDAVNNQKDLLGNLGSGLGDILKSLTDDGLLNKLTLDKLLDELNLCQPILDLAKGLKVDKLLLTRCPDQTIAEDVLCTPPPVPDTPVTPTSDYCTSTCTAGLCCEANSCPQKTA